MSNTNGINTYNESPLHAAIKVYIAEPGDLFETTVDGYIIDVQRGELLIEVQTRNFSALKAKLFTLTQNHRVRLVHPIALKRWIVKPAKPDDVSSKPSRRKSPKRGRVLDIFTELVSFPKLIQNPNFTLEVLYTHEEEIRRWDERRMWRRKGWATDYRRLLEVIDRQEYTCPGDFYALLPSHLAVTFTVADLASACKCPARLARQAAYCLKHMGVIDHIGMRGRAYLYQVAEKYRHL